MPRDSFRPSDLIVVKPARPSMVLPLGAFVRLASGGPIGVLLEIDTDDKATVCWLTVPIRRTTLPDVCLIPVSNAFLPFRSGAAP